MNALSAILVRTLIFVVFIAQGGYCASQRTDESLTKDFKKLSAKERTKIAERETKEAAEDSGYQNLMRNADIAFQAGRYQEALATFEQARTLRPYNVYPKVKIQDLQALIKKQDLEKAGPLPPLEPVKDTTELPAKAPPPAMTPAHARDPNNVGKAAQPAPPPPTPEAPKPPPAPHRPLIPPGHSETAEPKPDQLRPQQEGNTAVGERIYMEAGAVVTERTVEDEGRPMVYKKVAHGWGQTFYFKDGHAIPQREWDERFIE